VQVLILGGTGSIGAPVVRALVGRGHHVIALARSNSSATKAASLGANPLGGDIAAVERWLPALPPLDAVVHLACDFGSDMVDVDSRLLDGLLPHLAAQPNQATFIYTGGCWLFGATADDVAHVHVEGGESGAIERGGDFDLAVDTLLAQHRKLRPRTVGDVGHGNVVARVEAQMRRQPRVAVIEEPLEFLVSAFRIVAQALHGVARPRPRAMELDA